MSPVRLIRLSLFGLLFAAAAAQAQSVSAPHIQPNDSWTYQDTVENKSGWHQTRLESTVEHAGPAGIARTIKETGSTMPPKEQLTGLDWSRSVNGQQTVVNRPLAFPLSIGKSWTVEYTEDRPNRQVATERRKSVYKVTGWEDVTVPAGTFHALKIEADGDWTATTAPAATAAAGSRIDALGTTTVVQTGRPVATTASGRAYKAFWYVPAAKKWVKFVEEYYDTNGTRSERFISELMSFRTANRYRPL
jgi:hypothetical protein